MLGTACAAVDFLSGGKRGEVESAEEKVARAIGMEIGALKSWRKAFKAGTRGQKARKAYDQMRCMVWLPASRPHGVRTDDDVPQTARLAAVPTECAAA
jgi:hypothetical protein